MEKKTWGNATVWGSHGLDFLVPCFIAKEKNEHTKCSAHNWFSNFAIHKSSLDAPKLYKLSQICWCEGKKQKQWHQNPMDSRISQGFTGDFPHFPSVFFGFVMDFPRAAEAVDHRPAAEEEALRVQRHRGSSADHRSLGPRASHRGVNLRGICWVNSWWCYSNQ